KNKERQEALLNLMRADSSVTWWNYFAELATTDLSTDVKKVKVPMLVLPSIYDADLQGFETYNKTALDQWNRLDHSHSQLPITVIHMENSRAYATEDQPEKLDEFVRDWTKQVMR